MRSEQQERSKNAKAKDFGKALRICCGSAQYPSEAGAMTPPREVFLDGFSSPRKVILMMLGRVSPVAVQLVSGLRETRNSSMSLRSHNGKFCKYVAQN
jgi:hypothetical protein